MRTLTLDATKERPLEIGVKLLCTLCFPGPDERVRATRTAAALISRYVLNARRAEPGNAQYSAREWPHSRMRINRASTEGVRGKSKHALDAGAITLTYLKEPMIGEAPILPKDVRHNVSQLFSVILETPDPIKIRDARNRVLARWLPVAHLAAAYRAEVNRAQVSKYDLRLDDLDATRARVEQANEFAKKLPGVSDLAWSASDPVILEWIE